MREIGIFLVGLYFSAVGASIGLAMIAQRRFYRAYIGSYGDRRRRWQFWLFPRWVLAPVEYAFLVPGAR